MAEEGTALGSEPKNGPLPEADTHFLIQLRAGDAEAGHRFIRDYYPGVYRYLLYLSGHRETAEDLTQETFLQAWRHLDQFQGRAPLRLWLHQIARREFLRARRCQRPSTSLEEVAEFPEPRRHGWTDEIELRVLLDKLPEEQQEVMILHTLVGHSSGEIARITQAPASTVRDRLRAARARLARALGPGDLPYLNEPAMPMRQWAWLPLDQMHALETRLTLGSNAQKEGSAMERREFLRQAAAGAAGLMLTEPEKEVVDPRLTQKVTCAFKATALSDLCEKLKTDTGISVTAGPSVADEKLTLFCDKLPLREVMRQLSRPFGYTWLRSGTPGMYRYELVQDLRSQLLEEELRNRDRNEALIALDREIEKYRPYLDLSPDEALARAKSAPAGEKTLLEQLAGKGWGPIQLYFRLAPQELAMLRAGQGLLFDREPQSLYHQGAKEQTLPPELRSGVLQSMRHWRLLRSDQGFSGTQDATDPRGVPLTAVPECRALAMLIVLQSEPGRFTLLGQSGFFTPLEKEERFGTTEGTGPIASGTSAPHAGPVPGTGRALRGHEAALRATVTLEPHPSCWLPDPASPSVGTEEEPQIPASPVGREAEPRVTSADVLEALHRVTKLPLVGDYYTRLYKAEAITLRDLSFADALDRIGAVMRLRWAREGGWLQFRSTTFYDDRLKEVPNRLLDRWAAARRQQGILALDNLLEIAELPDPMLDGAAMVDGARAIWGLREWDLARNDDLRKHLRFLAGFTAEQRRQAESPAGLLLTVMPLAQQQRFLTLALQHQDRPMQSLGELAGAILRVDYTQPGGFEWQPPGPEWLKWVVPKTLGPHPTRALVAPVRERTREAALAAARRVDASVRERIVALARRVDPRVDPSQITPDLSQIVPTRLELVIIYIPSASGRQPISVGRSDQEWVGGVIFPN